MSTQTYRYTNETFSGCDITASISLSTKTKNKNGKEVISQYNRVIGELQTVSYSIHMDKTPVRSIGNVNAKDYVAGPRTIAGSLVFSVFNKHFAKEIIEQVNSEYKSGTAYLVDELPPFDITLSFANEYGYRGRLVIYGVRLLNEGQVMSINDVFTENTYQFFATDLEYLTDEMQYIRDKKTNMYKLNDSLAYNDNYNPLVKGNGIKYFQSQAVKQYNELIADKNIVLSVSIKQPTTPYAKGIADFFIDPPQDQGNIYIKDSNNNTITMAIKAKKVDNTDSSNAYYKNNKVGYASIKLSPGSYTAYFQNDKKKKSNTVKFKVQQVLKANPLNKYAPVIERLTDTEVDIFANEPLHDKVKITTNDKRYFEYDIKNRRCKIKGLTPKTQYTLVTYKKNENINSPSIKFKTLSSTDIPYKQLELYIAANASMLIFKDLSIYNALLAECKGLSDNSKISPKDSITKLKNTYVSNLKALNKNEIGYEEKHENLTLKIKALSELLMLAMKMNNHLIANVNKQSLPMPKKFYDDNYDINISFSNDTRKAEFFRVHNKFEQYDETVFDYSFKTIKNHENSYRYLGKPGLNHYVQAVNKNVRSPRLDFYIMNDTEKEAYVNNKNTIHKLSDKEIEMHKTNVSKTFNKELNEMNSKMAFMINAKKIENPAIAPITLEQIEYDNLKLKTNINKLIADKTEIFYIAFATYNNILNNDFLYKVQFTPNNEIINIDTIINNIKDEEIYAMWIENKDFEQISNASTFLFDANYMQDNLIKEYELKDEFELIEESCDKNLSDSIRDILISSIENNEYITSINLIEETINTILQQPVTKSSLIGFLSYIKTLIGTIGDSSEDMIYNLNVNTKRIKFDSDKKGSIVIYKVNKNIVDTEVHVLNNKNEIKLDEIIADYIFISVHDNTLLFKSDLIFINKKEKYIEVI